MNFQARQQVIRALRVAAQQLLHVDPALVTKLQSELRKMTKIYQAIPTDGSPEAVERFQEARKLFVNFHNNIESLVYEQILTKTEEEEKKDWSGTRLRKIAWTFLMQGILPSTLFPTQWKRETDKHDPAPWLLQNKRATNIRRYQRLAREFFEALTDFINHKTAVGEPTDLRPLTENTSIAGLRVIIHNKKRGQDLEDWMEGFLQFLDLAKARLQRAGFANALRDLEIHVGFDAPKGLTAGQYFPERDELWVFPLGFSKDSGTFIHELGHRFYFKNLDRNAQLVWDQSIDERFTKVSPKAVDIWVDAWSKAHAEAHGYLDSKGMMALAEQVGADLPDDLAAQVRYLADHQPYNHEKNADDTRKWHLDNNVGEQVAVEHISDYGATNAWEAFAEAFKHYVLKGPSSLKPWTRQFFKDIVRSGGAKVRSKSTPA
jgi:hypothetical protein